jgi:hypothetical protein
VGSTCIEGWPGATTTKFAEQKPSSQCNRWQFLPYLQTVVNRNRPETGDRGTHAFFQPGENLYTDIRATRCPKTLYIRRNIRSVKHLYLVWQRCIYNFHRKVLRGSVFQYKLRPPSPPCNRL